MSEYDYRYCDEYTKEYLIRNAASLTKKKDEEINILKEIERGIILPAKSATNRHFGNGGVLNEQGEFVEESVVHGSNPRVYLDGKYSFNKEQVEYIDQDVVYCGYMSTTWGQFLVSSTARLWARQKGRKLAYVYKLDTTLNVREQYKEFFGLLGISWEDIYIVTKPTQFRKIIVPMESYVINSYYSDKFLNVFRAMKESEVESHHKIYLNRLFFPGVGKKDFGERIFNDIFSENGFKSIAPEKLPLSEQIGYYRQADTIVVTTGSVSHNLLFASDKNLIVLKKSYLMNSIELNIFQMMNLKVTYIDCHQSFLPIDHGTGPYLLWPTEKFYGFCKDNNFKFDTVDSGILKRELKQYVRRTFEMKERPIVKIKNTSMYFCDDITINFLRKNFEALKGLINTIDFVIEVHFSVLGWKLSENGNGEMIMSNRNIEALRIDSSWMISYRARNKEGWSSSDSFQAGVVGLKGKGLPITAVSFRLDESNKNKFIMWRVFNTSVGWSRFFYSGEVTDLGDNPMNGIQILLSENKMYI